jgi:hypothetical protein
MYDPRTLLQRLSHIPVFIATSRLPIDILSDHTMGPWKRKDEEKEQEQSSREIATAASDRPERNPHAKFVQMPWSLINPASIA